MFRSYWGLILTAILGLIGSAFIWLGFAPPAPVLPAYQYEQPRSGEETQPGPCQPKTLSAIANHGKAASERERCAKDAEDHRLQTNDLIQQTRAANAAELQAWIGYQGELIGVFQTIGGFLTLLAAAAAALYAKRAADLSHKTLVATQRAYIMYERIKSGHGMNSDGVLCLLLQAELRNAGPTPAINANIFISWALADADEWPDFPNQASAAPDVARGVIGGTSLRYSSLIGITVDDIGRVWRNEKRLLIYSIVTYHDVFTDIGTKQHETSYCVEAEIPGPPELIGKRDTPYVVNFRAVGDWNHAT